MHYYYKLKIKKEVIRLWKQANYLERTKALALDRQPEVEVEDDDEELEEDVDTKGIPLSFKMKISTQMFSIESDQVKKEVEKRRTEDAAPPELSDDENLRVAKLVIYQQWADSLIFFTGTKLSSGTSTVLAGL